MKMLISMVVLMALLNGCATTSGSAPSSNVNFNTPTSGYMPKNNTSTVAARLAR